MADRATEIGAFLDRAGWASARRRVLAGDASARRYDRLEMNGGSAVLMDDPAFASGSTARFLAVGDWLAGHGYSVPRVLAADADRGLLLLEDFGDGVFTALLDQRPDEENRLYSGAIDVLSDLHRHAPPKGIPVLDGPALAGLVELALDWYLPAVGARRGGPAEHLPAMIADLYGRLPPQPPVVSLRDFHAGNLIWLPGRAAPAHVGLLDFQDAVATHPAYDVVSLLQDARRDVSPATQVAMVGRYLDRTGLDGDAFRHALALLGAQRQLRILGVFARLCLRDAKASYVGLIPRVWAHLRRDLRHPALAELSDLVAQVLPEPTPERLTMIENRCATCPSP